MLAAGLAGCSAEGYARDADGEVGGLLEGATQAVLGAREQWVLHPVDRPEPAPEAVVPEAEAPETPASAASQRLDLVTSLKLAVTSGREYLDQKETLYLQGLGLTFTRFRFGPLLDATVAHVWGDAAGSPGSYTLSGSLGLQQLLDTGGSFSLDSSLSTSRTAGPHGSDPDKGRAAASSLSLSLTQPLLRGAGYDVSHEALTQAERSLVYAVRSFELFREDYSIGIASDFFRLVSQKKRLANLDQDLQNAVFDREKTVALQQIGRAREEDVFLARRRAVDAENALLVAGTSYERAVDTFKIRLGLPVSEDVAIIEEEPRFQPVRLDPDSAVEVALHNRLDLVTERERLQDVERAVRLARDGLLPDLDLNLGYGLAGADPELGRAGPRDRSLSASLTFDVPVQRTGERNAYRSVLIARDRARRDLELRLENVRRDTVNQLRELDQVEERIALQEQQIAQEQRNIAVAEIRLDAGEIDGRDLLDARQAEVDAKNALIDLKTDHFVARLELMRDLGLLFIDDHGGWRS